MLHVYEETLRIIFLNQADKPEWKRIKVKVTSQELVLYTEIPKIYLYGDLSLTEFSKNYIGMFEPKTQDSFLLLFRKKCVEILKILTTKISSISSDKDIEEVLPFMKSVNGGGNIKKSNTKNFLISVFNSDHRKKIRDEKLCTQSLEHVKESHLKLFGGNLATIFNENNNTIPPFLYELLENVETQGLNKEGIYRRAGSSEDIQHLKQVIDERKLEESKGYDIFAQTSVIKVFFRELEFKLIPRQVFENYKATKGKERFDTLLNDVQKLEYCNRYCLYRLIKHFELIDSKKTENLMDFSNLSVVFGPTLVDSDAIDSPNTVELLRTLLLNSKELLSSKDFMDSITGEISSTQETIISIDSNNDSVILPKDEHGCKDEDDGSLSSFICDIKLASSKKEPDIELSDIESILSEVEELIASNMQSHIPIRVEEQTAIHLEAQIQDISLNPNPLEESIAIKAESLITLSDLDLNTNELEQTDSNVEQPISLPDCGFSIDEFEGPLPLPDFGFSIDEVEESNINKVDKLIVIHEHELLEPDYLSPTDREESAQSFTTEISLSETDDDWATTNSPSLRNPKLIGRVSHSSSLTNLDQLRNEVQERKSITKKHSHLIRPNLDNQTIGEQTNSSAEVNDVTIKQLRHSLKPVKPSTHKNLENEANVPIFAQIPLRKVDTIKSRKLKCVQGPTNVFKLAVVKEPEE